MSGQGFDIKMISGVQGDGTPIQLKAHIEHQDGKARLEALQTLQGEPLERVTDTEYRLPDGASITVNPGDLM